MDSKEIRELIELISQSSVSKFEMERDGLKLKVIKERAAAAPAVQASAAPQAQASGTPVEAAPAAAPAATAGVDDGTVEVNAPIVGTFYRSPSPDSPSFVEVGAKVGKGQVLCIIEAMKVMNEIEAELDGEIVEILVADGQPVEYGETIFRLRPA